MAGADAYSRSRKRGGLFDQPYLLLSLTSLFWAGNTIVGRVSAGHIPPLTLACIRWGGAFLILLPFAALHLARDWPTIRKHAGVMALLAFTGFSGYNAIAYYALQYTTAINGLLMQSSAPLFVALWSFVSFGERLTAAPGRRHLRLARRRPGHHQSGQSRPSPRRRLQLRRSVVSARAFDLRLLHGGAAQPAADAPAVVSGRRHGGGDALSRPRDGLGTRRRQELCSRSPQCREHRHSCGCFRHWSVICCSIAASI